MIDYFVTDYSDLVSPAGDRMHGSMDSLAKDAWMGTRKCESLTS